MNRSAPPAHAYLLADAFSRIEDCVADALDGLTDDDVLVEVEPGTNTMAWLIWHLTRIMDDHVAHLAGVGQVRPDDDLGYGHDVEQMRSVRWGIAALLAYHRQVQSLVRTFIDEVPEADLARIVDESFTPPVTMAVRLISVVNDSMQHVGQAALIRGILERRSVASSLCNTSGPEL